MLDALKKNTTAAPTTSTLDTVRKVVMILCVMIMTGTMVYIGLTVGNNTNNIPTNSNFLMSTLTTSAEPEGASAPNSQVKRVGASMPLVPTLFVGTAHMSDMFKAMCVKLKAKPDFNHNACPEWPAHVVQANITNRSGNASEATFAQFLYRPLGEGVTQADIAPDLLQNEALVVVYGRGILDLYHYNTPLDVFRREVQASLTALVTLLPKAARIIAYAPHKVYPSTPSTGKIDTGMRLFPIPALVCVTIARQKAYREAFAEAARSVTAAEQSLRLFDPWPLTTVLRSAQRPTWLGHHYPPTTILVILKSLFEFAAKVSVQNPLTLRRVGEVDLPAPYEAPAFSVSRECDCRVYAPGWCAMDRELRKQPIKRSFPIDTEYETAADRPTVFSKKVNTNLESFARHNSSTCGGDGSDPAWMTYPWRRRRIDDRSPFKPPMYQMPCDDTLFSLGNRMTPYSQPDHEVEGYVGNPSMAPAFKAEQCFYYFSETLQDEPYILDIESCVNTAWVRPVGIGSSYEHYLHGGLNMYLAGVFDHYRFARNLSYHKTHYRTPGTGNEEVVSAGQFHTNGLHSDIIDLDRLVGEQQWTHFVVYHGGHDETFTNTHPRTSSMKNGNEVIKIVRRFYPEGISIVGVLEHAFWGRPPFSSGEDPCMNPMRQDAFRSGMYCMFRYIQRVLNDSVVAVTDAYPYTSQEFSVSHGNLPDGNHYVGLPNSLTYANIFHRACGELVIPRQAHRRKLTNATGMPLSAWLDATVPSRDPPKKTSPPETKKPMDSSTQPPLDITCDGRLDGNPRSGISYSHYVSPLPNQCLSDFDRVLSMQDTRWLNIAVCSCDTGDNNPCRNNADAQRILSELHNAAVAGKRAQGWSRNKERSN